MLYSPLKSFTVHYVVVPSLNQACIFLSHDMLLVAKHSVIPGTE